jgi:hypothetical protein
MTGLQTRLEGKLVACPITTVSVSTQSPRWVSWLELNQLGIPCPLSCTSTIAA